MASIGMTASLQRICSSYHAPKRQQHCIGLASSVGTKQATHVVTLDAESHKGTNLAEQHREFAPLADKSNNERDAAREGVDIEASAPKFTDERWKNGTWDLNMFVKNGNMDWDSVIVAEAKRRKFLELYPEESTNEEPVLFRSSIIPWWAWLMRSHLPEAELLNGRAAMIGFFMAYFVDALTGLDMVGQTGNFVCKAGLFVTVISVLLLRKTKDLETLKKLADEATFYDKQWKSSWEEQSISNNTSKQTGKKF